MMLAVAGGIMLAATVFSLIVPALEIVEDRSLRTLQPALVVGGGILLGALAIFAVHSVVPHEHFAKDAGGHQFLALGRNWLFILAITLHNLPEGLSVGVAFGPGVSSGFPVAVGIGIQNMPEGLAVAAALTSDGASRLRSFMVALATGLVEPIGGLIGALVIHISDTLLPWGLAFAGGAMLFVIVGEIIPETYRDDRHHGPTLALVAGFLIMMMLDVTLG
jgi:ZIP family zinc transporter